MEELDKNVFIKSWNVKETIGFCIEYVVCYIDYSSRVTTFTKESTKEQIKSQLLYLIDKDLKEKGWVKEDRLTQHQMFQRQIELEKSETGEKYDPAKDPYYKQEWLYVNKEIN